VTYPDGSDVGYGRNADGSFSPPSGRFATFASVSGGYSLTDKNGTVYTFSQSIGTGVYGITCVADAWGGTEGFGYTSGLLTTAASAVLANEHTDDATYSNVTLGGAGPLPGSSSTSAVFNGTSSSVRLASNLVQDAQNQTISMWFKTTATSQVLFSYQRDAVS